MKSIITISLIILLVILFSCNKDNPLPPEDQPQVTLSLEDASCTEAWIKLSTNNVSLPADVFLYRDSSLAETISLSNTDSLLYIDSLLPNQTYSFHTIIHPYNHTDQVISNQLPVTTMDTTSHNFTWQTWTFGGQAGSCTLYDVVIIDENNIWAVGEIYLLDSLGQPDPQAYGIAKWNGQTWEPKKIFYNNNIPVTPKGILVAGPNDIYLASGSAFHWDGTSSTVQLVYSRLNLPDPNGTVEKLWGNSEMLYGVGNAGTIVTYQNGQWSIIESGTAANLNDVWGIPNQNGGFDKYVAAENSMLKIDNNNVVTTINGISGQIIISVWGKSERLIYTAGNGVVLYKNNAWEKIDKPEVNSIYRIKGEELNEIYGISSPGNVIKYFNGYNWYTINTEIDNRYWQIVSKANKVAVSGYRGEAAIVTIITKN